MRAAAFAGLLEFAQQILLLLAELNRRLDGHLDIEIAVHSAAAHHRHSLAAQAELPARLRTVGNGDLGAAAIERGDIDRAAQRRGDERNRAAAIEIMAIALEEHVRRNRDEDVEIAWRSAVEAPLPFAREANACAFLDARRNIDCKRALLLHMARACASLAGIADEPAGAAEVWAGALDGEEALLRADLPRSRAARALLRFGARLRTRAAAAFACNRTRHLDVRRAAFERFLERDGEVVAEIAAAVLAARAAAAHELAEKVIEHVGEGRGEIEAARPATIHAILEGGVTEAVIGRPLLVVLEDVVGFVDFLEFNFGRVVAGIAIGVTLHRCLAEGGLNFLGARSLLAAERIVIAALHGRDTEDGRQESEQIIFRISQVNAPIPVFRIPFSA